MTTYARARVYQDAHRRRLQEFFDSYFAHQELRSMLDAGCGYELSLDIPRSVRLVGLDVSAEAVAKNENIDEAIVGDLERYPLPEEAFDAVMCWWVLEHLPRPRQALTNLASTLRPEGLLVIAVPNLWSFKGLVTKLTPHRFHIWAYRTLFAFPEAGQPGFGPYRTYLARDIGPHRLRRIAAELGLECIYEDYDRSVPGQLPTALRAAFSSLALLARIASLNRWDPLAGDYIAVFRKRRSAGRAPSYL